MLSIIFIMLLKHSVFVLTFDCTDMPKGEKHTFLNYARNIFLPRYKEVKTANNELSPIPIGTFDESPCSVLMNAQERHIRFQ